MSTCQAGRPPRGPRPSFSIARNKAVEACPLGRGTSTAIVAAWAGAAGRGASSFVRLELLGVLEIVARIYTPFGRSRWRIPSSPLFASSQTQGCKRRSAGSSDAPVNLVRHNSTISVHIIFMCQAFATTVPAFIGVQVLPVDRLVSSCRTTRHPGIRGGLSQTDSKPRRGMVDHEHHLLG